MKAKDKLLSFILFFIIFLSLAKLLQILVNYDVIPWGPATDIITIFLFLPMIFIISVVVAMGITQLFNK